MFSPFVNNQKIAPTEISYYIDIEYFSRVESHSSTTHYTEEYVYYIDKYHHGLSHIVQLHTTQKNMYIILTSTITG